MKILTQISRILVGILFVISGVIKLNDPTGFSYKLEEYFAVFSQDFEATQDSIAVQVSHNGELAESRFQVLPADHAFSLTFTPGNWSKIEGDTLLSNTATVSSNGEEILSSEVRADSSGYGRGWNVVVTMGDNELLEQSFSLQAPGAENDGGTTVDLDITPHKKSDNFMAGVFRAMQPYSLPLAIFVSWAEAIVGFALLIGWQMGFTSLILFLMWAFFTFLTWYSWIFNKVTDCGCFGDAIPMNPYESFIKNVVLGVFVLIIMFGRKHIRAVFSNPFGVKLLTTLSILMIAFSLYCRHYLPVVDFLHYKEGNNLCELMQVPEGERAAPWKVTTYVYKNAEGEQIDVIYDSDKNTFTPTIEAGWTFVEVGEEVIKEEAYEPPIHDFKFYNAEKTNDYIDDFFSSDQKLLAVMYDLKTTNVPSLERLNEIAKAWQAEGKPFWALTSSSPEEAEAFRHEHQLQFEFHFGDNTNLKSIIRSNPGLVLVKDTCVVEKVWPSTRLPKYEKVAKRASK